MLQVVLSERITAGNPDVSEQADQCPAGACAVWLLWPGN